jgi:homoserine kinase
MLNKVRAFAPATVANISCGFDILGFALEKPGDEIIATLVKEPGVKIIKINGHEDGLSYDPEKNCATVPIIAYLKFLGLDQKIGIEIELFKNLPLCSGMGSSAASSVVGLYAVNRLLGDKMSKSELLPFILKGEELACGCAHADNAAPSLLGGITLIRDYSPLDIVDIDFPESLYCSLVHPDMRIDTLAARDILPVSISLNTYVKQSGNLAGLIAGLIKNDISLIGRSLNDIIVEPVRGKLIPAFDEIKKKAMENGALGFSISGSGPSVFALSDNAENAESIAKAMEAVFKNVNLGCEVYVSKINSVGSVILKEE